jgi:SAM-dependent methyltransferase
VAASPIPVAGTRVLDLGAGTGVATEAARQAGASHVAAVDLAAAMLRAGGLTSTAVVGDVTVLPFRADAFDLAVAACVLGHLPDPIAALGDVRRVAGAVVASAFVSGWTHPAKVLVDATAAEFGFVEPHWHAQVKSETEPKVNDPDRLAALASAAGWGHVSVSRVDVDTGLATPAALAEWRLGMAHLAPWVNALDPGVRAELQRVLTSTLADAPPLVIPLLILAATGNAQRSDQASRR